MMLRIVNLALFVLFSLFLFDKTFDKGYYNWDSLAYSYAVHINEGLSIKDAHALTYQTLKQEVSNGLYEDLCCSSKYRRAQFENPDNLDSMMPMYALKPGYIFLIKITKDTFQVSEFQTMSYISSISILLIAALIFFSFFQQSSFAQYLWIPVVFLGELLFLGKLMTPDAISALLILLGTIGLLHKRYVLGYVVLGLSLLFRLDLIVAIGLLGLLPAIDKKYYFALANSALYLFGYFIISYSSDHVGWWPHFYTSLVSTKVNMSEFDPDFSLSKYLEILYGNFMWILNDNRYIKWFATSFALLLTSAILYTQKKHTYLNIVGITLGIAIFIKFILFPKVDSRVYLSIFIALIYVSALNFRNAKKYID